MKKFKKKQTSSTKNGTTNVTHEEGFHEDTIHELKVQRGKNKPRRTRVSPIELLTEQNFSQQSYNCVYEQQMPILRPTCRATRVLISLHPCAFTAMPAFRVSDRVAETETKTKGLSNTFSPPSISTVVLRAGRFPYGEGRHAPYLRGLSPQQKKRA